MTSERACTVAEWIIRWRLNLAGAVLALLSVAEGSVATAQDVQVTPEQLQLLQSLSPEERDALLSQITGGAQAGGGAGAPLANPKSPLTNSTTSTPIQTQAANNDRYSPTGEPLLRSQDYLVLDLDVITPEVLSQDDKVRIDAMRARIVEKNPYRLDQLGALRLPGFEAMPLAGLTSRDASKRLQSDRDLKAFLVRVTLLMIKPTGDETLQPFGYELFQSAQGSFGSVTSIPVPAEYVVGPGDQLNVQLYGNQNRSLTLVVDRDGRVNIPQLGPVSVGGQRFSAVKASIESRVSHQMIGVRADVAMGDTSGVRVFVLGEVAQPGSYAVSGLSTVTSALFAGGGITKVGSLRKVQLKRAGKVVRNVDLYDLLLNGDTSNDAQLIAGDVIFVPPVGLTASVNGEVRRPAIYELKDNSTAADLLFLAGGPSPQADARLSRIDRIDESRQRTVVDVNLTTAEGRALRLQTGDFLRVPQVREVVENSVSISGFVDRPGSMAFRPGIKITDVLPSIDELKPGADPHYILVRRENPTNRAITYRSVDLTKAIEAPDGTANLELAPRDRLFIFDHEGGRDRAIAPRIDELRAQSRLDAPLQAVAIAGRVKAPGQYPLETGMRVSDLLRAGGNLEDAAYGGDAELTRYDVINGEQRQTELVKVDLAAVLRGDSAADVPLKAYDLLNIKETPNWRSLEVVTVTGEVRFPGKYPIRRGETLHTVLNRAGGLTPQAFPEGSVFTRDDLKKREQEQIENLTARLKLDVATLALQSAQTNPQAAQAFASGQSLLVDLGNAKAVGRLVIDLDKVLKVDPGALGDISLKDGDQLIVPRRSQEVSVLGEVQNVTSHLYQPDLGRDDYIAKSGGVTQRADKSHIYVVRADGSVTAGSGGWFHKATGEIHPGDTVVVPLDTEHMRPLALWTAVTQVIYNLAIAVAAVNSF